MAVVTAKLREDKIMSLDFQRMRSVGTVAGRFVGETSIADRTSHQKGGVGCAVHVHGAWLGEQKNTAGVVPEWGLGYTPVPRSVSTAAGTHPAQLEHHILGAAKASKESSTQTQIF